MCVWGGPAGEGQSGARIMDCRDEACTHAAAAAHMLCCALRCALSWQLVGLRLWQWPLRSGRTDRPTAHALHMALAGNAALVAAAVQQ